MKRIVLFSLLLPVLAGCDQLAERAGIPDPVKVEAEGKAIGSACRHAGRGLEDCYRLNAAASKPAVFTGWKEMNEYMLKNNMQAVIPTIPPELPGAKPARKKKKVIEGDLVDLPEVPEVAKADKAEKAEKVDKAEAAEKSGH